mgnify:FL=1
MLQYFCHEIVCIYLVDIYTIYIATLLAKTICDATKTIGNNTGNKQHEHTIDVISNGVK